MSKEKRLQHSNLPEEACIITYPDKNYDGWWTAENLHKQVRDAAIPIFDAQFPNAKAIFAFDNTTSQAAFAGYALVSQRMNLGPGGKEPVMRNGMFGDGTSQSMVFPTDHPLS